MVTDEAQPDQFAPSADVDIVVGIVAPLGADVERALQLLDSSLDAYGYRCRRIRLSEFLRADPEEKTRLGELAAKMNAGDQLRRTTGRSDILAALGIAAISQRARRRGGRRRAWVLHTLKHDAEVALLRKVYGDRFVLLAVGSPEAHRLARTVTRLVDERPSAASTAPSTALMLVARDQRDESDPHGQRVRDAFARADHFIDFAPGLSDEHAMSKFERLAGLLFGRPFATPTIDEAMMHHAYVAALRSSDTGRQVGAVLSNERGDLLAVGSNEVPRAGGGEYWVGDDPDGRDFNLGFDYNRHQIARVTTQVLDALADSGLLGGELNDLTPEDRAQRVAERAGSRLKETRLMSLIEFGRVVHAEMAALMQAARQGTAIRGSTLYTTAFPCHMCMRLIISAGIARVVFVDPYPKSLAAEMYSDSLSAETAGDSHVGVDSFEGMGWNRFQQVFAAIGRRKGADGAVLPFDAKRAHYRFAPPAAVVVATAQLEALATTSAVADLLASGAWQQIDSNRISKLKVSGSKEKEKN